jgi:hypothetical protein
MTKKRVRGETAQVLSQQLGRRALQSVAAGRGRLEFSLY